jgi:hypothetical protein
LPRRRCEEAPAGLLADRPVGPVVDAVGEELGELAPALVEDRERGVARAGQLAGGL